MPTFADREREFEARFQHDQELQFKVRARRNHMLGLWAAQHLGLLGEAAEAYAKRVVDSQFEGGGDRNVIEKVAADLSARDAQFTTARVGFELDHFAGEARRQLQRE
jgi:hypothetical protein